MTQCILRRINYSIALSLLVPALLGPIVASESVRVERLINGRNSDAMILKTSIPRNLTVLPTESGLGGLVPGAFKARKKAMSMAALILTFRNCQLSGLAHQIESGHVAAVRAISLLR